MSKEVEVVPESAAGTVGLRATLRSWRYFIWLLAAGIAGMLFYAEEDWRGARAWTKYQQQARAEGKITEARQVIPKPVPISENFAMTPLLAPLYEFVPGTQRWVSTNAIQNASGFAPAYDAASRLIKAPKGGSRSNSWTRAHLDLRLWETAFAAQTNTSTAIQARDGAGSESDPQKKAAVTVLAALAEAEPAIEEIRTAMKLRYSRFNLAYDMEDPAGILLPHLAVLKHFSQVLQLRASAELALHRTEIAAQDVALMLDLAGACQSEPIIISQLVRIGQFQLALQPLTEGLGQWSGPQLKMFEQRLRQFDFCADVVRAIEAERVFFGGGIIDFLRRNPDKYNDLARGGPGDSFPGPLLVVAPRGWFDFEKVNYWRGFDAYRGVFADVANHRVDPDACTRAEGELAKLTGSSAPALFLHHRLFTAFLMPSFSGAVRKAAFWQSGADVAATACAIERYRLETGHLPDALEAIESEPELPRDLITGQKLRYHHPSEGGSYLLYSVGWNKKDDGGKIVTNGEAQAHGREWPSSGDVPLEGDWVWQPY